MKAFLARFWRDKSAATALEYGVIAGLTAAMIALGLTRIGSNLSGGFSQLASHLDSTTTEDETGSIMDIKRADRTVERR